MHSIYFTKNIINKKEVDDSGAKFIVRNKMSIIFKYSVIYRLRES